MSSLRCSLSLSDSVSIGEWIGAALGLLGALLSAVALYLAVKQIPEMKDLLTLDYRPRPAARAIRSKISNTHPTELSTIPTIACVRFQGNSLYARKPA